MAGTDYATLKTQIEESIRKSPFRPSRQMREVMAALKEVCDLRGRSVSDDKTHQMLKAHDRLGKACEVYSKSRQSAKTDKGKTRLDLVDAIHAIQKTEKAGIDAMRSLKARQEHPGMTWGDVLSSQREKTIDITNKTIKTVGGGSSTRYVVELENGKTGYFTEHQNLLKMSEYMDNCAKNAIHPEVREGFLRAAKTADLINDTVDTLASQASNSLGANNFTEYFLQKVEQPGNQEVRAIFGYDNFSPEAKAEFCELMKDAGKLYTTRGVMLDDARVLEGANISNRNIATSRLAELLGQENLIARSQRLCVVNGEKEIHGVVMDQAVGIDMRSSNLADKIKLSEISDFSDPEFQRQITTLEIMDILSGQVDRNQSNMFYQVSESADGKRRVTGIQGIDNDAAFGLNERSAGGIVPLTDVKMIDASLAENLLKINREVLDYTFGDILTPAEIQALDNRLTQVKDHVLNGDIKIKKPDEWTKETAKDLETGSRRYVNTIKQGIEDLKSGLDMGVKADNKEKSEERQMETTAPQTEEARKTSEKGEPEKSKEAAAVKPKEARETEKLEETVVEKGETEKQNEKVSEKGQPEKAAAPQKEAEIQKPERHGRKEVSFEDLQKWEGRRPSSAFEAGRRVRGELKIGQHHRTKGGPAV